MFGAAMMIFFNSHDPVISEDVPEQSVRASDRMGGSRGSERRGVRSGGIGEFGASSGREMKMEGLFEFIIEMQEKNPGDLNFLELVRYGAMIGELDSQGAQDLIDRLDVMVRGNPKLDDFTELATGLAFMRWCEVDGATALAELMVTNNELLKEQADDFAESGIRAWTSADPEGARTWIDGEVSKLDQMLQQGVEPQPSDMVIDHGELYKTFLESYVAERGQEALEIFANVQSEQIKSKLRDNVIESLAERENSVVELQNLLALTEPGEFNSRREVMRKLAVKANRQSRSWIESQPATKERDHLVTMIAGEYLKSNPKAAAEWYLSQELVEENRNQDRYSRIFGEWRQKDLAEANEWLRSQPDTISRDTAESLAANSAVGQKEYVKAVEWVSGIQNEGLRQQALDRVFKNTKRQENGEIPAEMIEAAQEAGFEVGP